MTLPEEPWPPLWNKNISEQVRINGYQLEEHKIITEDGFILTAFRVPGKLSEAAPVRDGKKTPIYMQHGLLDDGGTWFFNKKCLSMAM